MGASRALTSSFGIAKSNSGCPKLSCRPPLLPLLLLLLLLLWPAPLPLPEAPPMLLLRCAAPRPPSESDCDTAYVKCQRVSIVHSRSLCMDTGANTQT
jgi:hypothetical protein